MDTVIQKFRSALGGFNRQDVQAYIEHTAAAHQKELAQLQERADLAERRAEELEAALSGAEIEKSGAAAEEAKVRSSLEASTKTLSKLRGELTQTESKLVVAKKELERLQAQVGTLEPMATSYAQLKDRVATVELDAHRRAQAIQEKAERDAQRVRRQLEQWLRRMEAEYDRMRGEVEVTVSHAASELDRVRAGLNRITQLVDDQEGILEGISKAYGETAGPKLEAPMPIPEEE